VKIVRESGLLRVTFDTPERRNVLTADDCSILLATLTDRSHAAMLIQAEGAFFCGGLEPGADPGPLFDPQTWRGAPVIAAVQGPAIDEGVALIACAHAVVAAQGTSFALTAMRAGVFPSNTCRVLSRALGERRALELALTARVFTVNDALAWGLVHQVAPAFELDDRAESIAGALALQNVWLQDVLC